MTTELELTAADISKLKVAELRAHLETFGLETSGLKADLANRLQNHIDLLEKGKGQSLGLGKDKSSAKVAEVGAATRSAFRTANEDSKIGGAEKLSNHGKDFDTTVVKNDNSVSRSESPAISEQEKERLLQEHVAKLKKRAEKFGTSNIDEKQLQRLERFGSSAESRQIERTISQTNSRLHDGVGVGLDSLIKQKRHEKQKITSNHSYDNNGKKDKGKSNNNNSTSNKGVQIPKTHSMSSSTSKEIEKMRKRAEKFGEVNSKILIKENTNAMKEERAKRFAEAKQSNA